MKPAIFFLLIVVFSTQGLAANQIWQMACQEMNSKGGYSDSVIVIRQPQLGNQDDYRNLFNFDGESENFQSKKLPIEVIQLKRSVLSFKNISGSVTDLLLAKGHEEPPVIGTADRSYLTMYFNGKQENDRRNHHIRIDLDGFNSQNKTTYHHDTDGGGFRCAEPYLADYIPLKSQQAAIENGELEEEYVEEGAED